NPFNYSTRIKFDISKTSDVKLKVYNLLGKEIDEIVNSKLSRGSYDFRFIGSELPSGVYFCRLVVDDNKIDTKKMVLIK
ncbi:MAG: T9SS type A sorting domain-containing protein, partial [Ignavibacteria bacterium]|nr:T9SS type A sorting domain-containing protein [Ignavibacteria bacterium]